MSWYGTMKNISFSGFVKLINSQELNEQLYGKTIRRTVKRFAFTDLKMGLGLVGEETLNNVERLQRTVNDNIEFLKNNIFVKNFEVLTAFAELEYIEKLFEDKKFLCFLAKNSLTNRIVFACKEQKISEPLKFRLRQCMGIYCMYNLAITATS